MDVVVEEIEIELGYFIIIIIIIIITIIVINKSNKFCNFNDHYNN